MTSLGLDALRALCRGRGLIGEDERPHTKACVKHLLEWKESNAVLNGPPSFYLARRFWFLFSFQRPPKTRKSKKQTEAQLGGALGICQRQGRPLGRRGVRSAEPRAMRKNTETRFSDGNAVYFAKIYKSTSQRDN